MQTACDGVAAAAEFTARMQHGENNLQRRQADLRMDAGGHAAPVILNEHGAVGFKRDGDMRAEARQRFVDRVIHNFINQMMQSLGACRTDIHTRTLAHRLQSLQDLYLTVVVFLCCICHSIHSFAVVPQSGSAILFLSVSAETGVR